MTERPPLNGTAGRFWLVLQEPGLVPERKGSWPLPELPAILREFMKARPTAYIHVLTVNELGEPFVQHGPEALQMADGRSMSAGRYHNERTRTAHAEHHMTNLNGDSGELVERACAMCVQLQRRDTECDYQTIINPDGEDAAKLIGELITASNHAELSERVRVLEALVREAERAWVDTAILLTHPDPETRQSAKDGLYAWRDKARALLTDKGGE